MTVKYKFNKATVLLILLFSSICSIKAQNNLIPNTQDCSATRPPFAFNIQRNWITNTGNKVFTCSTPLAGDIDGDGKTEIFALTNDNCIYVFEGETGVNIGSICPGVVLANAGWTGTSFCLLDGDKNGRGEVFIAAQSGNIYLYEVSSLPGVRPITFTQRWAQTGYVGRTSPAVADLDGDGVPEFVAGNLIFDYSGNQKATLAYKGNAINFGTVGLPLVVDLDKDRIPEIVVGTNVYKYNGTTATLWTSCPNVPNQEGCNMAADVDQDGNVDLVFHTTYNTNPAFVKVWTPATGQDLGNLPLTLTGYGQRSIPFVGDIDGALVNGKKYPEICINTDNAVSGYRGVLYAYSYDGTTFTEKWSMNHSDGSGGTILTLFDFNNDGIMELIYRDETHIHIFDGSGAAPVSKYSTTCGSETASELPIVVDALGTGSANIVVTGNATGKSTLGEVMLFEGAASKWMSCPPVWNQQLYSNLHVNTDLTIPTTVESLNLTFTRQDGSTVQFYNGGPIQAPYISAETYLPIDISSDVYIMDGSIEVLSPTSVKITITVGNQGLIMAPATTPIHYYKNSTGAANIIDNTVLGVDLHPGQTTVITKTITGLPSGVLFPASFYVRLLDDGTNFPAAGAFSDCNLTNNTKSFGTFELTKTANSQSACVDGTVIFTIKLVNNSGQLGNPQTYNNIIVTDSLNSLVWEYVSDAASDGTTTPYSSLTHKLAWNIPTLVPGDTVQLILVAKAKDAGAIRNSSWIESIGGTPIGKEAIEAYVIVASQQAPSAASVLPVNSQLCPGGGNSVTLTAVNAVGATSYQWYRNNVEITGATSDSYAATQTGSYRVTYFNGTCVSQMSSTATISENCIDVKNDIVAVFECDSVMIDVLANDTYSGAVTLSVTQAPTLGSATVSGNYIKYKDTGSCDGGKTDKFKYTASAGADSKQAEVKVFILKVPRIILQDSCSTKPKLILNIHYPATYEWWYSSDGVNYTTNLGINSHEHYPTLTGWYEVRITYTLHGVPLTKNIRAKYTILETVNLPTGQKWYVTRIEY